MQTISIAKAKLSELKRPKTGEGPKPPSPSPVEQSILENLEDRPSLEGIAGGIDTAGNFYLKCNITKKMHKIKCITSDYYFSIYFIINK